MMEDLIQRLEKAEGPNFKLDFEVWCAAHGHTPNWDTGSGLGWYVPKGCDHVTINDYWPAYTASLDAAVGLVPEGWTLQLFQREEGWFCRLKRRSPYALVAPFEDNEGTYPVSSGPLALCIAALKARQSEKGTLTTQQGDTND